jgi:hypothetical protein
LLSFFGVRLCAARSQCRRRSPTPAIHAARRFLEFFAAEINNDNTRMAYYRAVCSFFAWLDQHRISELADIEPLIGAI